MSDDWKGEHLISAKGDASNRRAEHSRLANVVGKINGYQPPLRQRRAHGAFVKSAIREAGGRSR